MSDLDDLRKLQERLNAGQMTPEEYARERDWILGGSTDDSADIGISSVPPQSHVIDLHEIEEAEARAAGTSMTATNSSQSDPPARGASASGHRIPTVWKVILTTFLIWILLIATAVVYLRIRNVRQPAAQSAGLDKAGTQSQAGSETAQNAAQEIQNTTAALTYETFVAQLETILTTYYGDAYSITDDGKTLTVSLMGEGIAADAMYVVQGADGAAAIWSELKASMQTLAVTCFDGANAQSPERHVVLNILNDQNQENVILSYLDGTCIYDATETSDLNK